MSPRKYYRGSTDGKRPLARDPLRDARGAYDAIVIGSGLGGLTAARTLGRAGHSVCVLEQHYNLGGLATWFKRRGGHVFDISLHGFPAGMRKTCRKYWSPAIADSVVRLDGVRFDNPQFRFATEFTRADFTEKLVGELGCERAGVERFYARLRAMNFYDDDGQTVRELFEEHFPDRNDVHRLLLEPISYANGSTLDDPAIAYGIVFSNFMSEGVFTFRGGTDRLVQEMKLELERQRVDVFHDAQVERVLVERGRVCGVQVNGREIRARAVISNASVVATIDKLVGAQHFSERYQREAHAVRLSNSSCQVYLGLREGEELPFQGDLLFSSTRARFDSEALCDLHGLSRTFSFYYPKTRPGSNRYAIVSSTNARWSDWAPLDAAGYEREKAALIEETCADLERLLPGVRAKLEHIEASTPRTFHFYTQQPAGASFGTKFEGLKVSERLPAELHGLFHTGSVGIIMSGWLGAVNYGVIVANRADAWLRSPESAHAPSGGAALAASPAVSPAAFPAGNERAASAARTREVHA